MQQLHFFDLIKTLVFVKCGAWYEGEACDSMFFILVQGQ